MKFSQTQKLIFGLVILAIAGFVLYNTFFAGSSGGTNSLTASTTIDAEDQNIVDMASKMDSISIDTGLFTSPIFLGLTDFDQPLSPEPQGRPDPFAGIGSDITGSAVATSSPKK